MGRVSGGTTPNPALYRLLDELADDLMGLTDAELLAETAADGIDQDAEVSAAKAAIAAGIARVGRERLAVAKAAVFRERKARVVRPPVPNDRRGEVLARFAQDDVKLRGRLTMAARNGEGVTESEIDSILADLRELGAVDEKGDATG